MANLEPEIIKKEAEINNLREQLSKLKEKKRTVKVFSILDFKKEHPNASLRAIASAVHSSHEYVRLVLNGNDIKTGWETRTSIRSTYPRYCTECNNTLVISSNRVTSLCKPCKYKSLRQELVCPICSKKFYLRKKELAPTGRYFGKTPCCSHSCAFKLIWRDKNEEKEES